MPPVRLASVCEDLPEGIKGLRTEAAAEGYRFLERLAAEWSSGAERFDGPGELLLAAYLGSELAGIGGMTIDPVVAGALRIRRFYVRPSLRGLGVGRQMALFLLEKSKSTIFVNAGTADAAAFWKSLGFVTDRRDSHTHKFPAKGGLPPLRQDARR